MKNFFDPSEREELLIPIYGKIHLITILVMIVFIIILLLKKDAVRKLVENRRFMIGLSIAFLVLELSYLGVSWGFKIEPFYERFPLHLCATLSFLLPILILLEKYKWLQFFSYWAISSGFISFANPSFEHVDPWSFDFIHYLIRHYFLILMPIFLHIGRGYKNEYRFFLKSWLTLGGYAFIIFLFDWATGANYLYLGKHSSLEIPFLPTGFADWPWVYPSFVVVGMVLLHLAYLSFRGLERKDSLARSR